MLVDSLAWHRLLGALTLCVHGQTFDLWCSILARSRGTVLLIFGIDPASGPASQIQKVRARAERRIAFPLRPMLCPHRKPLRGGFLPAASSSRTWTLRTARKLPRPLPAASILARIQCACSVAGDEALVDVFLDNPTVNVHFHGAQNGFSIVPVHAAPRPT